jgi:hypothetical protein
MLKKGFEALAMMKFESEKVIAEWSQAQRHQGYLEVALDEL